MVNPLMNMAKVTSTKPNEHPRVDPVPERVAGQNWPYRGMETHGVDPNNKPDDMPGYDGTIPVEYVEKKIGPDPIPVRIVGEGGLQLTDWNTYSFTVFGNAQRILDAERSGRRRTALIKNLGPNNVYIGPKPEIAAGFMAWKMAVGETFSTNVDTDVYAIADVAQASQYTYSETPGLTTAAGQTASFDLSPLGSDVTSAQAIVNVPSSVTAGNAVDYVFQTSEDNANWVDSAVTTVTNTGIIRQGIANPNRYVRIRWRNFTGAPPGQTIANVWIRAYEAVSGGNAAIPQQATIAVYLEYDTGV